VTAVGSLVTLSCLQKYQEEPYTLAAIINWFLVKEKEILNDAELAQQVSTLKCYHHHHPYYQHQHILILSLSLNVSGADVAGSAGYNGVGEPETNGKKIKRTQDQSRGLCVFVCICLYVCICSRT